MWKCINCSEENEDTFDACWNCGTAREGTQTENIEEFQKIKKESLEVLSKQDKGIAKGLEIIPRPTSVTVISWILIVTAILYLVFVFILLAAVSFRLRGVGTFISVTIFSSAIALIVAIAIREGHNWARIFYLWLQPIAIIFAFVNSQIGDLQPIFVTVVYTIVLFFLTRPNATLFFKQIDGVLPKQIKCPLCETELELEISHRTEKQFTCPNCDKFIDLSKNFEF